MQKNDMQQEEVEKLIASIGSMAELTALYYGQLIEHDIPSSVAIQLTQTLICTIFTPNK